MVYYSENENPDRNIENEANGWMLKDDVKDFTKIKTYLINIQEYTINIGKKYTFNYTVNIPEEVDYNMVSYCNHAVYYDLNTTGR